MPAFGTLYQRLTLPESKRFKEAQNSGADSDDLKEKDKELATSSSQDPDEETQIAKKAHFKGNRIPYSHDRRLTRHQNSWNTSLNGVMPKS